MLLFASWWTTTILFVSVAVVDLVVGVNNNNHDECLPQGECPLISLEGEPLTMMLEGSCANCFRLAEMTTGTTTIRIHNENNNINNNDEGGGGGGGQRFQININNNSSSSSSGEEEIVRTNGMSSLEWENPICGVIFCANGNLTGSSSTVSFVDYADGLVTITAIVDRNCAASNISCTEEEFQVSYHHEQQQQQQQQGNLEEEEEEEDSEQDTTCTNEICGYVNDYSWQQNDSPQNVPSIDCGILEVGVPLTLVLQKRNTNNEALSSTANCFRTPPPRRRNNSTEDDKDTIYRVQIKPSITNPGTTFSFLGEQYQHDTDGSAEGYYWNFPAKGVSFCAPSGHNYTFTQYWNGGTVNILILSDEEEQAWNSSPKSSNNHADDYNSLSSSCVIEFIGLNNPYNLPETTATFGRAREEEISWSSYRWYLHASSFEYQLAGNGDDDEEEPIVVSLANATMVNVSGSPGDETYTDLYVEWYDPNGWRRKFVAYMQAKEETWQINEMWVNDGYYFDNWIIFENVEEILNGKLGECFHVPGTLNITNSNHNGNGNNRKSEIRFQNLTLAAFLPWENKTAAQICMGQQPLLLPDNDDRVDVVVTDNNNGEQLLLDKSTSSSSSFTTMVHPNNAVWSFVVTTSLPTLLVAGLVADLLLNEVPL